MRELVVQHGAVPAAELSRRLGVMLAENIIGHGLGFDCEGIRKDHGARGVCDLYIFVFPAERTGALKARFVGKRPDEHARVVARSLDHFGKGIEEVLRRRIDPHAVRAFEACAVFLLHIQPVFIAQAQQAIVRRVVRGADEIDVAIFIGENFPPHLRFVHTSSVPPRNVVTANAAQFYCPAVYIHLVFCRAVRPAVGDFPKADVGFHRLYRFTVSEKRQAHAVEGARRPKAAGFVRKATRAARAVCPESGMASAADSAIGIFDHSFHIRKSAPPA